MTRSASRRILVAPSLLACDFGRLEEEVRHIEEAGADWLHVDVMDGHFVPNITIGPVVVEALRRVSHVPLDVHLMIQEPQRYVRSFLDAGAHSLTAHIEAPGVSNPVILERMLKEIHRAGARAGLSLRPGTGCETLKPFLADIDLILVMTVEPGFGGQAFLPEVVPKVRQVREWFDRDIAVDGGINAQTGRQCCEAGANVLVAGTFIFRSSSYKEAIHVLRGDS